MIPEPLLEDIATHRCLLFIGAGFSLNAELPKPKQMPDWNGLVEELRRVLKTEETDSLKVASEYSQKFGKTKLIEKLSQTLHIDSVKPGDVHRKLAKIDFDTIYTTNFDYLLEQAYSQEKSVKTIATDSHMVLYSPRTHINIIKMHGDFSHIDDLTITEEDYESYLNKHPVIATHLSDMFATRTPLFIGYSLSDPHLDHIHKIIREHLGEFQLKPYIVKFDATEIEIKKYEKDDFIVINLSTEGKTRETALLEFLCDIQDFIGIKAVRATSEPEKLAISTSEKSVENTRTNESLTGRIVNAFSKLEVELRIMLEKFGVDKREIKKPFHTIMNHAINLGWISPTDLTSLNRVREIRNEVVHSQKNISMDEVSYIEDVCNAIINKIQRIEKPSEKSEIKLFIGKNSYEQGETIVFSGQVSTTFTNMDVVASIVNPTGQLISISQIPIHGNHFESSLIADGPLWNQSGRYVLRVLYAQENNHAEIPFEFKRQEIFHRTQTFEIKTVSDSVDIKYSITGNSIIENIVVQPESKSLQIVLQANSDGELSLVLPRSLIDARLGADGKSGDDDSFFVLLDGVEMEFTETTTDNDRVLSIKFDRGTTEIEIIGTHVFETQIISKNNNNEISILAGSSSPQEDEKYLRPQMMIVNVGDTVVWSNDDSASHTVTSGTPESGADGKFDSGLFPSGTTFSHTFTKKGTYRYYCLVHPWKEGKIIVK